MKKIEICVALILNEKNEILATQRINKTYDGYWEFPGGKIEANETHHDTLIRELKEELDVEITVGNYLMSIQHQYPDFHLSLHAYFAKITKGHITLLEHGDAIWLSQDKLSDIKWLEADIDIIEALKLIDL